MPARKVSARSYFLANKLSCLSVVSVIFVEGIASNYHKSVFFSNSYYYKLTHGLIRETILLSNVFFCMKFWWGFSNFFLPLPQNGVYTCSVFHISVIHQIIFICCCWCNTLWTLVMNWVILYCWGAIPNLLEDLQPESPTPSKVIQVYQFYINSPPRRSQNRQIDSRIAGGLTV